jgi:hypothetical protein
MHEYNAVQNAPARFRIGTARFAPCAGIAIRGMAFAVLSLAAFVAPHDAVAYDAANGMEVNQVNDNVFEVIPRDEARSGNTYWCAAGEYAEQELRASARDQLYVARGMGPSETTDRVSAVQFTLDPAAAGITPAPLSEDEETFNVGGSMEIGLARADCVM